MSEIGAVPIGPPLLHPRIIYQNIGFAMLRLGLAKKLGDVILILNVHGLGDDCDTRIYAMHHLFSLLQTGYRPPCEIQGLRPCPSK
jgi:hypothetical protein